MEKIPDYDKRTINLRDTYEGPLMLIRLEKEMREEIDLPKDN
ncbi:hypothetical protein [Fundicoccus ignavus]|nr:hypothetical protein [Fundicoccus ignavus]